MKEKVEKNKNNDNFVIQHNCQPMDSDDRNGQHNYYTMNNVKLEEVEKFDKYNNTLISSSFH